MILLTHAQEERDIYYSEEALAGLRALDEVRLNTSGKPLAGRDFIAAASGCAIVVGDGKAVADAGFFEASSDLVAYVHNHVEHRRVDVEAASANGILVTTASPGFGTAVAELVLGFMIDLSRGITKYAELWHSGRVPRTALGVQLFGRTVGIIGYGHIGRHLAKLASLLGMRVLVNDPFVEVDVSAGIEQVSFDEILREADFVVPLAVPTPETANLIDAGALSRMKRSAFLINVSRSALVDEEALEDALERRIIAGAALDVGRAPFETPSPRLAARADVIATPHIGGVTLEATRHQALHTVRQVAAILAGKIPEGALNIARATRLDRLRAS